DLGQSARFCNLSRSAPPPRRWRMPTDDNDNDGKQKPASDRFQLLPQPHVILDPEQSVRMEAHVFVVDGCAELSPFIAALAGLAGELRDINTVWAAKQPPQPTDTRHYIAFSVGAVIALLRGLFPNEPDLSKPFELLLHDLAEVEGMRPVEAFTPLSVGGNPGSTTVSIATMRGRYAATVELLHRKGLL